MHRLPPFAPLWRCGGCKHGGAAFIFASRQLGAAVGRAAVCRRTQGWCGGAVSDHIQCGLRSSTVRVRGSEHADCGGIICGSMFICRARARADTSGPPSSGAAGAAATAGPQARRVGCISVPRCADRTRDLCAVRLFGFRCGIFRSFRRLTVDTVSWHARIPLINCRNTVAIHVPTARRSARRAPTTVPPRP